MNIIEFIMANLFFIILALWFLVSVFRRRRPQEEEQEIPRQPERADTPAQEQPRRTRVELPWENAEQIFEDAFGQGDRQAEDQRSPGRGNDAQRVYSEANQVPTERGRGRYEEIRRKRQSSQKTRDDQSGRYSGKMGEVMRLQGGQQERIAKEELKRIIDFESMDRKAVIQGFVWSEVFGQPRGRRKFPYGGFLSRQRM